jgi:hypothetical protein
VESAVKNEELKDVQLLEVIARNVTDAIIAIDETGSISCVKHAASGND